MNNNNQKVSIIGAGLVGSLAAINFAKLGHEVHLYEFREDIRTAEVVRGRSINLALSTRGKTALAAVGLEEEVVKNTIPMKGRMIHDRTGKMKEILYDPVNGQTLHSVGRKYLNEVLLNEADKFPNIKLHFNKKIISAKLDEGVTVMKDLETNEQLEVESDLIVGCDGAYSKIRSEMVKRPGFSYSQEYITHGYLELCIPPKNGDYQMPPNYLHIWPRNAFMMIALPNMDKSFTVTLSMPFDTFNTIHNEKDLLNFFETYFRDAISLIGKDLLIKDFFKSKPQHLISVKCDEFHYGSKVVILGDAAHAMVPYYGQGMNCGFEDCSLFFNILGRQDISFGEAIREFSRRRCKDAHAMCQLAMYNYVEMRDLVTNWTFLLRKKLDEFLFHLMPNIWVPLYNTVSFSNMRYTQCVSNRKWQDGIFKMVSVSIFAIILLKIVYQFCK